MPPADLAFIETKVWMAGHWKLWTGPSGQRHMVQLCPPGAARGSLYMRNRGLDIRIEVTVWATRKHWRLSTGLDDRHDFYYMHNLEKCEYSRVAERLGVDLDFAANWMERWRMEAVRLAKINEQIRLSAGKPAIRKEGKSWMVRGMNQDGTYTSAGRKFRAWEDAVRFISALEKTLGDQEK